MTAENYYPFVRWSLPHWGALLCTLLITVSLLAWACRQSEARRFLLCRVLALLSLFLLLGEQIWRACVDDYGSWQNNLPLHFCSFMAVMSFIALYFRCHLPCAILYFGVLTASVQGLITPAMANGYPSIAFFFFFASHGLLLLLALAVPFLLRWRARGYDDLKALLCMDLYLLAIIPVNLLLGTNYGYTQYSPVPGCALDYLGAAPWYYLWLQLPMLAVFRLMMLLVHDKRED